MASPAAVAYLLPIETILSAALTDLDQWLPGQLLAALAAGGTDTIDYTHALTISALYTAAAATTCITIFHNRDITA